MAKKITESVEEKEKLTVLQICNEKALNGLIRKHVETKFKDRAHSLEEWEAILKKERIDF